MSDIFKIPVLTLTFKNHLEGWEIPAFRGAVISKVPRELTLFHNHIGDSLRYSYPLVQYKTIRKQASIVCVGEGTESIASFFEKHDYELNIGERVETFAIDSIFARQWILQTWDTVFDYSLRSWIPFNADNFARYNSLPSLQEKVELLTSILTGNIISMGKGLGYFFGSQVNCEITDILAQKMVTHKGVKFQSFTINFLSNVYLPDNIGIGKGVSMGFGVVKKRKSQQEE